MDILLYNNNNKNSNLINSFYNKYYIFIDDGRFN